MEHVTIYGQILTFTWLLRLYLYSSIKCTAIVVFMHESLVEYRDYTIWVFTFLKRPVWLISKFRVCNIRKGGFNMFCKINAHYKRIWYVSICFLRRLWLLQKIKINALQIVPESFIAIDKINQNIKSNDKVHFYK